MTARPTSGVRYSLERVAPASTSNPDSAAPSIRYEGFAHLPTEDVPLVATVTLPSGAVTAESPSTHPRAPELVKAVIPLLRAATRAESASGQDLPRKIVRWRG